MTTLEFDGIAFDPDAVREPAGPAAPEREAAPAAAAAATGAAPAAGAVPTGAAPPGAAVPTTSIPNPLAQLRAGVADAHRAALAAQYALQRALWERAGLAPLRGAEQSGTTGAPDRGANGQPAPSAGARHPVGDEARIAAPAADPAAGQNRFHAPEWAFKPLARTTRTHLDQPALRQLADGDITGVFGPNHHRPGIRPAAKLADQHPLVLIEVTTLELFGTTGRGHLTAGYRGDPGTAATQAAEIFALFAGLHLALTGSTLQSSAPAGAPGPEAGTLTLRVTEIDLVPRPHLTAEVHIDADPFSVELTAVEPTGADIGPGRADESLLLSEFHMTHLARGDQAVAMGEEFAEYTGVRATRLPTGGLLLVDRVLDFDGERGRLDSASYTTEYDSPADSWYYGDTANESMPHFVYMETSLQAALLMGYYAGPTRTQPGTTLSLRNLGGTATVLRRVDLRDTTIRQQSRLLSTTILPGSSLQTFDYTLSTGGEAFYRGETMFGYFSDEALANQTGLDAGRPAPTWLAEHPAAAPRTIDVAARRADPAAPLCSRDTLALIDRVQVVDGGGKYGAGYLHSLRAIDPADWYFDRHFHLDPVIPGSLGVESVIHAVQEWMLDAGYADDLADPAFRIPADIPFAWRYRGQFLPTDGTVELEAHIKEIRHGEHGVIAVVDGSLWKPGLRIYELTDLAIELGEREVRP
ncbi:beta-ketoacyl synthase [Nocardia sp. NPDC057353]|uniref:beta-ketoacyl synthase n=1 Tax=Nocardia sp. NPDC057353 TaxID=3346104 RepID=UPI00363F948F